MPHRRRPKRQISPPERTETRHPALGAQTLPVSQSSTEIQSPWGRVDEEYALIRSDLRRLMMVTALIFALLVVLTVILR